MKKVLLIATIEDFLNFEKNNIMILKDMGYEVHIAANSANVRTPIDIEGVIKHHVSFARNPISRKNITAYNELKKIQEEEQFTLIHCHTPVGGVMGRLLGRKYKVKTIYTAHGFHFFKGAPFLNWLLFYPIEHICAKYTDILITINKEDYSRAKKFKCNNVQYIPGVGIDVEKIRKTNMQVSRENIRNKYNILNSDFVLLSVGEVNDNKNHRIVIDAIERINNKNIKYFIIGCGPLEEELKRIIIEKKLENNIFLLGYVKDAKNILKFSDCFIFPSKREGLPVSLMEAMAVGIPCIASNIRGNSDLLNPTFLFDLKDNKDLDNKILAIYNDEEKSCILENYNKIKDFDSYIVCEKMKKIYGDI